MPNHVYNTLVVSASADEVQAIIDAGGFARKFVPMPIQLEGTISPTKIISQKDFYDGKVGITQAISDHLKENYGADNWYDWANYNWGTKWGDYNHNDWEVEETKDGCEVKYMTAWSPLSDNVIELIDHHLDIREYMWEEEQGYGMSFTKWSDGLEVTHEWDIPEFRYEEPMIAPDGREVYELMSDHITPDNEAKAGWYYEMSLYEPYTDDESKLKAE